MSKEEVAFQRKKQTWGRNDTIYVLFLAFSSSIAQTGNCDDTGVCGNTGDYGDDSHPARQPHGDITLLSGVGDLQLVVVETCAERPTGLSQTHIHDALSFTHVLQQLRKTERERHTITNPQWLSYLFYG